MNNKLLFKSIRALLVRGFGGTAAFFVTLVVTNLLVPSEAGIVLLIVGLIASLGQVATFGSSEVILKYVAGYESSSWIKINKVFSSLLTAILAVGFCLIFLSFLLQEQIAYFFLGDLNMSAFVMLTPIGVVSMAVILITSSALLGLHKTTLASILQSCLLPVLFLMCCSIFFFSELNVSALNLSYFYISCAVIVSIVVLIIWFNQKSTEFIFRAKIDKDVWNSIKPMVIVMFMQVFTIYAGQYATAIILSSSDLALFSAAQRTAMLVSLTLNAVNLVIAPKLSHAKHNNESDKLNVLALKSSKLMFTLATPVVLVFTLCSDLVMRLFGEEFVSASSILIILSLGQFINVMTGSVGYLLIMTNHEEDFRNVIVISGSLTLILSFILTYYFGLHGAAIATSVGLSVQNLLAAYYVKLRLGFNTLNFFRKVY